MARFKLATGNFWELPSEMRAKQVTNLKIVAFGKYRAHIPNHASSRRLCRAIYAHSYWARATYAAKKHLDRQTTRLPMSCLSQVRVVPSETQNREYER
jgi:hypothetical protein